MELIAQTYDSTMLSWAVLVGLMLVQATVVDVTSIRAKHIPGVPVEASHDNFLFRATRTVGNMNETIAIYILVVLLAIFSGANASYVAYCSWGYVIGRIAYAACYYSDQRIARSVCFGISMISVLALFVIGLRA